MNVRVRLFAAAKQAAGSGKMELDLPEADLQLILADNIIRLLKNTDQYDQEA